MGYVPSPHTAVGTALTVEIRGVPHEARVVKTPFHPSHTKKG
jgi:glycine cleavage system aminomethyltransferase T